MEQRISLEEATSCPIQYVLAINDTLNVISGKWKLQIIGSLMFGKTRRFTEIQRTIPKITPRMLSKELKEILPIHSVGYQQREVRSSLCFPLQFFPLPESGESRELLLRLID